MKTELKHYASYLQFNCKIWNKRYNFEEKEVLLPKNILQVSNNENYKLILHPLSDLVKEIEVNGKKIVPIVELAKIGVIPDISIKIIGVEEYKNTRFGCKLLVDGEIMSFFYHSDTYSFYLQEENFNLIAVDYQLQLFQKLFEWHFDIFGLIDAGLSVDINTL